MGGDLWVAIFGGIAALLGPRKGFGRHDAFVIGVAFGIFGVAYLALQPDR